MNALASQPATKSGPVTLGSVAVGEHVTACQWSDRHAYVVVGVTEKTVSVKRLTVTLDPNWKREFIPGGFMGHTVNNGGQWLLSEPAPEAPTLKAYWKPSKGYFALDGSKLVHGAHEYYDYNF